MAYAIAAEYCTAKELSDFLGLHPNDEYELSLDSGYSQTYKDRLYIGNTNTPLFSIGDYVRVWDSTNRVGEDHTVKSIGSNYIQTNANMTGDYEVADDAKFKPLSMFTNRSNPTITEVGQLILMAQDVIDDRIHNSYLSQGRRRTEWYNFMPHFRRRFPAFNVLPFTPPDTFWWIRLNNAPVHSIDHTLGDFCRINQGSSFTDIFDPATGYTEWTEDLTAARTSKTYWVDKVNGIIYLIGVRPTYTPYAAYIGYRHGEYQLRYSGFTHNTTPPDTTTNYIPYDIKKACMMLVCIDILSRERYATNAPGGELSGNVDIKRQIDMWQYEVDRILERHRNIMLVGADD